MAFNLVLVGKPNVGKSTLFNLLTKKKLAIVENIRGVTVDVKEANASLFDLNFKVIDTGGFNLDTSKNTNNLLNVKIWDQAVKAISKANLIAFIVDAKDGITSEDKELSLKLRKMNTNLCNIILIINKIDTKNSDENIPSALELGFKNTLQISAAHSYGLTELYETILPFFNKYATTNKNQINDVTPYLTIGVVGKPNVGKSTLINSLFKEERLITSNIPGTTRDAISLYIEYKKKKLRIIDTAGLRKKSKIENNTLEKMSNSDTIRTIIFSQVVILMISAEEGLTKQDLIIASNIINEGRAIMIVINKIDLIKNKQKQFINNIKTTLDTTFSDIKKINILGISALNNYNIDRIFNTALKIYKLWNTKIKTSFLNRWLSEELSYNPPPLNKGRSVKIKLITQIKSRPPTFNLWVNTKDGIPSTYLKFLQNKIYEKFNLYGIPIRLNVKLPNNPYSKNK